MSSRFDFWPRLGRMARAQNGALAGRARSMEICLAMRRFVFFLCALFLCAPLGLMSAPARAQSLEGFLADVWPRAQAAGVSRATFDSATANLRLEPSISGKPAKQGEFQMKISDYVAKSVNAGRIAQGRARQQSLGGVLDAIEKRSGVPQEILLAFWGAESGYGAFQGALDVLNALATHAVRGHRAEMFTDEFVAALVMLEKGYASREQLKGSWAGAMGQPQFMPSSYLKYATSYSGGKAADIWSSAPDVLASIGNFMKLSGWNRALPAVVEVNVPENFDWAPLDLDFSRWRALGFTAANGEALPASGAASIYAPEGASGPVFLITENWEVIRQYNTSDAYALSIALIAEGINGGRLHRPFRKDADSLSLGDRIAAQKALARAGVYDGATDGKLGRKTRIAVHAFQRSVGMQPADGFLSKAVLARLRAH
jgi:lytic murein transglycosylase